MSELEWLEIPGCEGYHVCNSPDPRIRTKTGRFVMRATVTTASREYGSMTVAAPRALYAALRGIPIERIPMQYIVRMENGIPVLADRSEICRHARETYDMRRHDRREQAMAISRAIRFHRAQAAAIASGEYAELFGLLISYYREYISKRRQRDDDPDAGVDVALSLVEDIKAGAIVYDPVRAIRSKRFSALMRRRRERLHRVDMELTNIAREEEET